MTLRSFLLIGLLCDIAISNAQPSFNDTSFVASAKMVQIKRYNTDIGGQARINNGSQYKDFYSKNDEHPYFGIDDWVYGDLTYDEEHYHNVPMFYDLARDKVIAEHALNGSKLELISEKVADFSLGEHQFIRIPAGETDMLGPGFVEVLYNGTTKVYARREKILMQKVESNDIIPRFDEKNRVYIKKAGTYYLVKSKRSVLEVFNDRRQELKSFLARQKIRFNADREFSIVRLATQYDLLSK